MPQMFLCKIFKEKDTFALAGVAQLVGYCPTNQKVIPVRFPVRARAWVEGLGM